MFFAVELILFYQPKHLDDILLNTYLANRNATNFNVLVSGHEPARP